MTRLKVLFLFTFITVYSLLGAQTAEQNFKQDISYLASDSLEGRLTGSKGEKLSAEYISDGFRSNGLKPLQGDSYIKTFETVGRKYLQDARITLKFLQHEGTIERTAASDDWYPLSSSHLLANFDHNLHFAGFGIDAPKAKYTDYKDSVSCKGKVFVIKLGHPPAAHPHDPIIHYSSISNKIETAIRFGAEGIIFIPENDETERPGKELKRSIVPSEIPVFYMNFNEKKMRNFSAISGFFTIKEETATGHNVVGVLDNGSKMNIVIGAHHDHLGHGEYGSSRKPGSTEVHNGADDNASGVAMMLQLMRDLSKEKDLKYNYIFMAFSGEELGLIGSKHITDQGDLDSNNTLCMLNYDMVGRFRDTSRTLMLNGVGTATEWDSILKYIEPDSNVLKIMTTRSGIGGSDHTSFYLKGIPSVHFFTGQHHEYHRPEDDEQLINYPGMSLVLDYSKQMIKQLESISTMHFRETKNDQDQRVSFKVTLGIMPDYVFEGKGLKIDLVSKGKTADNAGIEAGDILLQMGEVQINNIYDYTKCLSIFKKGQTVEATVLRDGKKVKKTVVF